METRAPFIIVGSFVLAAIGAVFGFVYWLNNSAGSGARTIHHVRFEGSVSGLLVGAAVLLFTEVFKQPLRGLARGYYRITGTWDNPSIERINSA